MSVGDKGCTGALRQAGTGRFGSGGTAVEEGKPDTIESCEPSGIVAARPLTRRLAALRERRRALLHLRLRLGHPGAVPGCAWAWSRSHRGRLHGRAGWGSYPDSGFDHCGRSLRAHEYRRMGEGISPRLARVGPPDGVGLAALPALWGDADVQVGALHPPPMDAGWPAGGAGAAPPLRALLPRRRPPRHVRRAVGVAGAGELVRARGAPVRHRPLAASGHIGPPGGGGAAELAWEAGTLAPVAAPGSGARRRDGVSPECEHGRAVAGPGGARRAPDGAGTVGGRAHLGATGHRWAVRACMAG
jgi:hypothetical protein